MRALGLLLLCAACGSNTTALPVEANCNPLGVSHCMVPWPSSAFEVDDASSATGRRLAIPEGTLPINSDNLPTDPTAWNLADGFSAAAPMVMAFPDGVSPDGLPAFDNMTPSMSADSPTLVIDMTTGETIAHFAEVDAQAPVDQPGSQALIIRPAQRLVGGHRYAVVITNKVKAKGGGELPVPPGFAALRDGTHTDHKLLEAMRDRFADVLDAIDELGLSVDDDVVVAWDFTVASDAFIHRDMIAARDRAVAALDSHAIAVTIATDAPIDDGSVIKRRITGTLDAPLFLSNMGHAVPGTKIVRDADGLPAVQGFYQIPFTAIVPACASTAAAPIGMVIYGHGLMGDSEETAGGVQQKTASEDCLVFVGTDMRGMSTPDLQAVASALNEIDRADEVMEVIEQGLVNHITLVRAMRTTFATTVFTEAGHSLVDPQKVYYYGLSQGAIMGTAVMAWEPTVLKGVLGVGAANYSMLLDRSADWPMYRGILNGAYSDALDDTLAINLFQMRWDKTEGSGIVQSVLKGNEGNPPKQLLTQIALSDEQVPNIGSFWWARSMGIPVVGPSPAQPWGLQVMASPLPAGASGLVIMDGGAPAPPTTNVPAPKVDPSMHNLTRTQGATRRQIKQFYETGMIVDECKDGGACVCETPTVCD